MAPTDMPTLRKAYVDLDDGQVHGHFYGDGDQTVLFLHQTASSGKMFLAMMRGLGPERRMVALDTPGFGGSFDPSGMPTMPDYADWIAATVDRLELRDVHIVAHHTGACIAAELAIRHDWIASLALIGPMPLTPDEREAFRDRFSAPMSPTPNGDYIKNNWDYLCAVGADSNLGLLHREFLDTVRAHYGRYQAYSAVWDQDFTALYQRIRQPMAILCAREDVLWPYFERARSMRPDAKAYELSGGNFEPDQDTVGCIAAIEDFWAALA
jgi:pimeloyl-ACP methyl ester carboxylesterase